MKQKSERSDMGNVGTTPQQTTTHHYDVGADKPFSERFQRNPSFDGMTPHCVVATRCCYCFTDEGVQKCEVGRTKKDKSVHFSPHIFKAAVTTKRKGRFGAADLSRAELVELDRDYQNKRNGGEINKANESWGFAVRLHRDPSNPAIDGQFLECCFIKTDQPCKYTAKE